MGLWREEHTLYCGQNAVEDVRIAVELAYALYDPIHVIDPPMSPMVGWFPLVALFHIFPSFAGIA